MEPCARNPVGNYAVSKIVMERHNVRQDSWNMALLIFERLVSLYLEGFILTEAPNCLNFDCMNMYKLLSS